MSLSGEDTLGLLVPENWHRPGAGPRYMQLASRIEQAIRAGDLVPGKPLPPEREIARIAEVSRVTVRKAIGLLAQRNLVIQRQGSGTFVAPPVERIEHTLSRLSSFTRDMRRRGKTSSSRVLASGIIDPAPEDVLILGLHPGEQVSLLERLRCADGVPLAIERSVLPRDVLPDPDVVGASLYDALERLGNRPVRALQRIRAERLSAGQADLLGVDVHDPALRIERRGFDGSGRVIEHSIGIYRGDAYDFVAELHF